MYGNYGIDYLVINSDVSLSICADSNGLSGSSGLARKRATTELTALLQPRNSYSLSQTFLNPKNRLHTNGRPSLVSQDQRTFRSIQSSPVFQRPSSEPRVSILFRYSPTGIPTAPRFVTSDEWIAYLKPSLDSQMNPQKDSSSLPKARIQARDGSLLPIPMASKPIYWSQL